MAKGNSVRRNSAFDTSKPEFIRPQTRLEANRWLDKVTFGAATALTDINASTKTNIVSIGNDEAVDLMGSTYAAYLDAAYVADPMYSPTENITTPGIPGEYFWYGQTEFGSPPTYGVAVPGTRELHAFQRWMINEGIYGTARARVRALYALSQMVVCNVGVTSHRDITSFGNILFEATKSTNTNSFKTMLKKVTYSRSMSYWLTYQANSRANAGTGSRPDENYAREIMQLFSIGLDCLNMDGTPMLDANGDRIPTYTPAYVPEAAKFFTGLQNYEGMVDYIDHLSPEPSNAKHETAQKAALTYPDGTEHILPAQTEFRRSIDAFADDAGYLITRVDDDTFTVQSGEVLGSGTGYSLGYWLGTSFGYSLSLDGPEIVAPDSARTNGGLITVYQTGHGLTTGTRIWSKSNVEKSIDYFLEVLTRHPTCAPYVAKSMIKLLVTNNPSPAYVERVARKFVDNGNGVYGDMSAVFKAIFLDRECIVPFGKNPNNHGRYTTLFDRFMKLANNLRNDTVHYCWSTSAGPELNGTRWGSPNRTLSASDQSVDSVYTSPRCKVETCGIAPDRAYLYPAPLSSPSVFNFYRPGYVPPKTELGELSLTAPELQITTAETQTLWTNIALAATSYEDQFYNLGEFFPPNGTWTWESLDPRSGKGRNQGLNLSGRTTATVTELWRDVPEAFGTGFRADVANLEHAIPAGMGGWLVHLYHRRLGAYGLYRCDRPNATGPANLTFVAMSTDFWDRTAQSSANMQTPGHLQVGDVFDVAEFFAVGHSGFPGRFLGTDWQPFITLLHRAATSLPDTPTVTNVQLNGAIDYLEGVLMTAPISDELRQLMKDAANKPVVLPKRLLDSGDSAFLNHYRYMVYGYSQIRIRRMLAILLVSPEFCTQY